MGCRCRHIIRTINTNVVNQPKGVIRDRNHISTNSLTYIYWCIDLASSTFHKINKRIYTNSAGDFR